MYRLLPIFLDSLADSEFQVFQVWSFVNHSWSLAIMSSILDSSFSILASSIKWLVFREFSRPVILSSIWMVSDFKLSSRLAIRASNAPWMFDTAAIASFGSSAAPEIDSGLGALGGMDATWASPDFANMSFRRSKRGCHHLCWWCVFSSFNFAHSPQMKTPERQQSLNVYFPTIFLRNLHTFTHIPKTFVEYRIQRYSLRAKSANKTYVQARCVAQIGIRGVQSALRVV